MTSSNIGTPQSVVFIDSNVPDLQDLLNGLAPGVEAFVIDPSSDGLAQIAAILATNDLTNLSSISIVGHGAAGQIQVGSTTLDAGDLSSEAAALTQIGDALAPGGAFELYACDVASGTAGQQFIAELSQYAGGVTVAASAEDIGTLQGTNGLFENWTLDDSTGTAVINAPFTSLALANYEGLLAGTTVTASTVATTLKTDADGDKGISPDDTVTSSVTITNTTSTAATGVTFSETLSGLTANSVLITPIAVNDSYSATGNAPLTVGAASGVLANDTEFNGGTLTAISATNATNGAVTLNADGSFTFTPTTGFSGTASFQYTAEDAAGNSVDKATVTIAVGSPTWYVNGGASGTQDGTAAHPFATIQQAISAAAADTDHGVGDTINVAAGSYSGADISLASGEKLIGAGSGSTTFTVSSGTAVTLGDNNTISGIKISNTGSGDGIDDSSSSTGTTTMSNIAVTTGSGTGISFTHGGIVDITGTANTISSSTGTALNVTNTTIGTSGITFKSISSGTGGSASNDGIILDNTGSAGGLTITGDGSTAGSGGTIENKTGTTGGASNGVGIYLNNTADVSLAYLQLNGLSYDGIYGQAVTNFSMDHTVVNGANGSAVGEGSVVFGSGQYAGQSQQNGVTGTVSITNSTVSGGWYDNLDVFDWSGTADVTLNNDTFGDNNTTHGNQNVYIDPDGTSIINATVTNSTWQGVAGGSNFYFDVNSTSTTGSNLSFLNNTVSDNLGGVSGENGSGGFQAIATGETGSTTTFDIENNAFSGATGNAVTIANNETGDGTLGGAVNLTFNNNTIGAATGLTTVGADDSGSAAGVGLEVEPNGGTFNASITNNQIYEFGDNGIDITADVGISSGVEDGTLNAEITGNTIGDPDSFGLNAQALQDDIYLDAGGANTGANDNFVYNATVGGSTIAEKNTTLAFSPAEITNGSAAILASQDGAPAFNLTAENNSTTAFEQYSGPANDSGGKVESFLNTWNSNGSPSSTLALSNGDFEGGKPSAEAPAAGPTFDTPSISGTDTEGDTLTASDTGGSATSGVTYQWQESFAGSEYVDIFGANASTYTLKESDVGATIRVVATATYSDGIIDTADSAATGTVLDALTLTQPTISSTSVPGQSTTNPVPGQILTASTPSTDNSDAAISYQWQANGVNISGASGQSFTVTSAQLGDAIRVVATATDPHGGDVSETSVATTVVDAFVGQSLSDVSIGTLPGNDAVTVTWQTTVNGQSDQLISNPTYTGTVSGSDFTTAPTDGTVPLDTLSLEGEIFNDANGNGTLDGGEAGISGVSLSVFVEGSSTALESTTTNGSGVYDFTGLAAGNYYVQINTLPSGYGNSSPVRDTTPNDYAGGENYGLAVSGGVIDTNAITIAYDQPEPSSNGTTYPGDDTTSTLDIGLVQAPQIGGTGNTVQYYQGGAAKPLDSNLTLTDSVNVSGATVTIGNFLAGDTLNFTTQNSISEQSYTGGVLTLTGNDTAADYATALDSITYSFSGDPTNAGADTTRTITWSASDTNSQTSAGGSTSTLDVFAQPIVSIGAAGTPTVNSTSGPVIADTTLSITDYNGTTIHDASVQITGVASDTLTINGTTSGTIGAITYSFTGSTLTLTGTDTVVDYDAALDEVKFDAVSPNSGTRTLTWQVNDEAGGSTNDSVPVTTDVDVTFGPQVTAGATQTFDGGSVTPVTLDSGLTVTDAQSTTLASATVSIGLGFFTGDTLTINGLTSGTLNDAPNGTIAYSFAGSTLTLTGTDTVTDYQSALQLVQYNFIPTNGDPTNGGGDLSRTVSWTVTDTNNASNTPATSTLNVVHEPPVVAAGAAVTYETEGPAAPADGALTVTDSDSAGNLSGATVTISGGFASGDTLNFTNQSGITGSYDALHGTLMLTGTASVGDYQTALDSIMFTSTSTVGGTRTLSWIANDGSTSNGANTAATSTVDVEIGPQVTAGGTATFDGGGTPVPLDGTLAVADAANGNLTGATVSITSNFLNGDTLTFIDQAGITGSYEAVHGVLTLTGMSSVANYQAALDSITYSFNPANGDPTGASGDISRSISWTVSDGVATSATAASTLDVVHEPPTVTAGAAATFDGGGPAATLDGALTVADPDSAGNLTGALVSISAGFLAGDTLTFTGQNSITGSYDAVNGILTLTGMSSVANYQTALDSITYSFNPLNGDPTFGGDTARVISWAASDGSTSNGSSNIATSALMTVHVAPTVTAGATATFELTGPAVTADGTLTVADPDSGGDLTGAVVSISLGFLSANDVLNFTNQNGITGSFDSVTGVLTLIGTSSVANYQTALDSITFSSTTSSSGSRTLSWTVNDGATSNSSNTATSTIDLVVGPQITAGATATFNGGGLPVALDGTLTVTDPAHANLTGAMVVVTSNFLSGDVLNFTNQNGITGSYDPVNGILTLTGMSSVANYQTALDSITYSFHPANGDATGGGGDITRTISWAASDSIATSATATSTLDAVHVAPTVTAGGTATFNGGGSAVTLDGTLTVSAPDSGGNLTGGAVSIGTGFTAGDILNFINQNNITGSYDAVTGMLTLSGTDTAADYQAALDSITYSFSPAGGDATKGGTDTSRAIAWQVNDGSSSNGLSTVAASTLLVPTTPVVTAAASNVNATPSESFAASALFSAGDAAGEPILTYEVEDESGGSSQGFWVLNGAVLPNGQITTLMAAQLSELSFVAGSASTPVSDTLEVAASDAAGLGAFTTFTVTAAAHAPTTAPTVAAANVLQAPSQALAGSSLFSGTAFDGNTIMSYEVEDITTDSGHWVFNGTVEPANQVIDVTVAQLAQLSFDTGYGSDTLMVRANDGTQWGSVTSFTVTPPPNAAPPAGTSATLVMLRNSDGAYEFYDIGHNVVLLDGPLGQINPVLQVAGVGGFNGADTTDLLMRDPTTGVFTLYDVSNNNITGNVVVGQVGLEWTVSGFGDFSTRANETDMLMRNSNTGQFEVYDIANNAVTFAGPMGQVGLEWTIAGFGDFSTRANETDMLMRNSNTGQFEAYDIANNAVTFAGPMGQVGLEWTIAGFGDFSGNANETDMLMRNSNTGVFEVYDIANNAVTFAGSMGQVGLEWTIAGFGDFSGNANETDMLMRNSNTGVFELYDINNNTVTFAGPIGQVGLEWSIGGVSATPASAPPATQLSGIASDPADAAPSSATAQLTQAMASFAPSAGAAATSSPLGKSSPVAETPNLFAAASQTPLATA